MRGSKTKIPTSRDLVKIKHKNSTNSKSKTKENEDKLIQKVLSICPPKLIPQLYEFYLIGDLSIDINQLQNLNCVKLMPSYNSFRRTMSVKRLKQVPIIEVELDMEVKGDIQFGNVIEILERMQSSQFYDLAQLLRKYSISVNSNVDPLVYQAKPFLFPTNRTESIEEINSMEEEEEWTFQHSIELAKKVLSEQYQKSKNSNEFYSYYIYKGTKYEQVKAFIGYPLIFLEEFMCMNPEQIDFLLTRKPFIYPQIGMNNYLGQLAQRLKELTHSFDQHIHEQETNSLNCEHTKFDSGIELSRFETDLKTIDNITVYFDCTVHKKTLSNYRDKKNDAIVFITYKTKGNFQPQDIIRSQRIIQQKKIQEPVSCSASFIRELSTEYAQEEQTVISTNFNAKNDLLYFDLRYESLTELFKEKFYSVLKNNGLHELDSFLTSSPHK